MTQIGVDDADQMHPQIARITPMARRVESQSDWVAGGATRRRGEREGAW
jgi:hypothetical protein